MKNIFRLLVFVACFSFAVVTAQNAPMSIAGAVVSLETAVTVPVYTVNFNNIGSCGLKLSYDPSVATATGVTIGPGLGGMISTNLTTPGIIIIGWFTSGGVSLPDSSVIFNIQFTRLAYGFSSLEWMDDGYSCQYYDGSFQNLNDLPFADYYQNGFLVFQSPDAPVTTLSHVSALPGTNIGMPVSVSDFHMIGSLALEFTYDPSVLTYISFVNDSDFPGLMVDGSQPGIILAEGIVPGGDTALTLENNATLFTLNFSYQGGFTELNWFDNGTSCQYAGSLPVYPVLNDTPREIFYVDGSVSSSALPAGAGPIAGPAAVCAGSQGIGYSVPVIAYANDYIWEVPDGITIQSGQHTNAIIVDYGPEVLSGVISVYGSNSNGNGAPDYLPVSSVSQPGDAGPVSGLQEVCQGQVDVFYSIVPIENATAYNWNLPPGATITSGANTANIMVSYSNTANNGAVFVSGSNVCGQGGISEPLYILVNEIPEIVLQPDSPPAVYAGSGDTQFTVQAIGSGLNWQWQEYITSWTDLNENEMFTGVNTDTMHIINPVLSMNGNRYRCVVSGQCEPPAVTDGHATLTVLLPVGINEKTNQPGFVVYPNPCSDDITLDFYLPYEGELSVMLHNLMGESFEIINKSECFSGNHSVKLNMAAMAPGIYTLSLMLKSENNLMICRQKIVCNH